MRSDYPGVSFWRVMDGGKCSYSAAMSIPMANLHI